MTARAVFALFQGVIRPQLGTHLFRQYKKAVRLEDLPDAHLLPLIAIVGRPNVGKSALFNRLVRKRDALVFDTPADHVTRDYREGVGQLADLQFRVIDTSGLEPTAAPNTLQGRAAALTRGVLQRCHGVMMLLDARQGVIPADEELLQWLRGNSTAPLMILANKADTAAGRNNLDQIESDLASVGFELATSLSATSGDGLSDLYRLLQPLVDQGTQQLRQQHGTHSSSSDVRQQLPAAYRFSALTAEAAAGQQAAQYQEQQQQQQSSLLGSDNVAAEAAAAVDDVIWDSTAHHSAADEAEVDRLLQEHLQSSSAPDNDGDVSSSDSGPQLLMKSHAAAAAASDSDDDQQEQQQQQQLSSGPLRLAILGLPNAGKSTLMNTLLGYERSLTGPEPGLTRDPTSGWIKHAGFSIQLVDTAGWKRATAAAPTQGPTATGKQQQQQQQRVNAVTSSSSAVDNSSSSSSTSRLLADASLAQAKRALSAVHVVVLLLDAPRLITLQLAMTRLELQIASLAINHGKALIIGLNKSDAVPGGQAAAAALREQVADMLDRRFIGAGRLPVIEMSAVSGAGAQQLLDEVVAAYGKWNKSVHSYKLRSVLSKHSLRFYGSGGTSHLLQRVKWSVQVKSRPPTFALLMRGSDEVDESGVRFLTGVIRQSLGLEGVPIRLYMRYNKRPGADKQSSRPRPGSRRFTRSSRR